MKETIQTNPAQANEEAEQLIKGKNKKNVELLVAIGEVYLKAGKLPEAQEYAALAKKVNGKSALASVLEGDIAFEQKNAGLASQKYEEAIYFDQLVCRTQSAVSMSRKQLYKKIFNKEGTPANLDDFIVSF